MSPDKTDKALTVGARVTYADVNLYHYRGEIVSIDKTPHGGDCVVMWQTPAYCAGKSEECLFNLRAL